MEKEGKGGENGEMAVAFKQTQASQCIVGHPRRTTAVSHDGRTRKTMTCDPTETIVIRVGLSSVMEW